jgi:hypothetical protein
LKKQGIVGVIRVVDHLAWSDDTPDDTIVSSGQSDKTLNSVSDVPDGKHFGVLR